jgi:hypothetical protein
LQPCASPQTSGLLQELDCFPDIYPETYLSTPVAVGGNDLLCGRGRGE